jgi:DNA-binding transcriptional ArsR family regulator
MDPEMIEEVAELFKALSEPTRLNLLLQLKDTEMTVSELADFSGTSMANISKHLTLMKRAGLVTRRKSGNHVYYSLRNEGVLEIFSSVCRDFGNKRPVGKVVGSPTIRKGKTVRTVKNRLPRQAPAVQVQESRSAGKESVIQAAGNRSEPEGVVQKKPPKEIVKEKDDTGIHQLGFDGFDAN